VIDGRLAYFNATMAKPFGWTYAGKPLAGLQELRNESLFSARQY
jgi:hypothetical protein